MRTVHRTAHALSIAAFMDHRTHLTALDTGCAMGLNVGCLQWVVRVVGVSELIARIGTSRWLVMMVVTAGLDASQ